MQHHLRTNKWISIKSTGFDPVGINEEKNDRVVYVRVVSSNLCDTQLRRTGILFQTLP
jgi:hypothetical protein